MPTRFLQVSMIMVIVALLPNLLTAQTAPVPYRKGNKWGFANRQGKLVVQPVYDSAVVFTEGLAGVLQNGKWGYIDAAGKMVIAPVSVIPYPVQHNRLLLQVEGAAGQQLYGLMDKTGKRVIEPKYDLVYMPRKNFIRVKDKNFTALLDSNGRELVPFGKYNLIDVPTDGRSRVEKDRRYGYIDTTGKEVIALTHTNAQEFSKGIAGVQDAYAGGQAWSLIDTNGKKIGDELLTFVNKFSEEVAVGTDKAYKWVILDREGKRIKTPAGLTGLSTMLNGSALFMALVQNGERSVYRSGTIDAKGNIIIPAVHEKLLMVNPEIFAAQNDGKWECFDNKGKLLGTMKYDSVKIGGANKGFVVVRSGVLWGILDVTGKQRVACLYDSIGSFASDIAVVRKGDKFGYIHSSGKEIVAPKYAYAFPFTASGTACYVMNDKCGFVNSNGKEITTARYDLRTLGEVLRNNNTGKAGYYFSNGLVMVRMNGRWGYLDETGREYWAD